jgi:hypothetical protein
MIRTDDLSLWIECKGPRRGTVEEEIDLVDRELALENFQRPERGGILRILLGQHNQFGIKEMLDRRGCRDGQTNLASLQVLGRPCPPKEEDHPPEPTGATEIRAPSKYSVLHSSMLLARSNS